MKNKDHVTFIVDGNPKGKGRPRFSRGHAYTPQTTKDYEREVALAYKSAHGSIADSEDYIAVQIDAFYPVPSKARKAVRLLMLDNKMLPTQKPDLDNVIKIILDGLNGVAYEDDKQVVHISSNKYFSDKPRVQVNIIRGAEE